jgi:class 3 adenylate cyclase
MNSLKQIANRIYNHFDTTPDNIELVNYRFYIVSNIGQTIAWSSHLVWMFIFVGLHIQGMAALQFISILIYVFAIILNRRGHHMASMAVSLFEIVGHQAVAVLFIGWECNFQNYIPVVAIFPFLIPHGSKFWKWTMFLVCMLGYIYIDFFIRPITPYYPLGDYPFNFFKISNIVLSFGCFVTWALYLTLAVNRAQVIIEDKTKQLIKAEEAAKQAEMQLMIEMKEKENEIISKEKQRYEELLLNILPKEVAQELKETGRSEAKTFEMVTVMFTDFKDFTRIGEGMSPEQLVREIDYCFSNFDMIIQKYGIEKIKTIGDAYMCAGGLPAINHTHAADVVHAAIDMRDFMIKHKNEKLAKGEIPFEIRIGIHSGPVVAGIVGIKKFAYDIWGDTVNTASRMESSGEVGRVNISEDTYRLVKDKFNCEFRGKITAKGKGEIEMYFAEFKQD